MKIPLYKTAILLLLVFLNTAMVAQEKKNKPTVEPTYEQDLRIKKQKTDSFNKKAVFFNKDIQLKKHRFDTATVSTLSRQEYDRLRIKNDTLGIAEKVFMIQFILQAVEAFINQVFVAPVVINIDNQVFGIKEDHVRQ